MGTTQRKVRKPVMIRDRPGPVWPVLLLVVWSPTPWLARAQEAPPDYPEIMALYRTGRYEEALGLLHDADPEAISSRLDAGAPSGSDDETEKPTDDPLLQQGDDFYRAAALMHTHLGMLLGEALQFPEAGVQLEIAEKLIERMRDSSARETFRRDQLLALGYFFQASVFRRGVVKSYEFAEACYDEAVERFPGESEIYLSAGTLHEWGGSLKNGDRQKLNKARELYRLALRANPRLAEAYLRYGRVLVKLGEDDEAVPYLLAALDRNDRASPWIGYVARMMLGGIAERQGDLDSAIDAYAKASTLIPSWQTAPLALSHALHVSGRYEESTRVLTAMLDADAEMDSPEAFDGWMVYELGRTKRLDGLWAKMRESISP